MFWGSRLIVAGLKFGCDLIPLLAIGGTTIVGLSLYRRGCYGLLILPIQKTKMKKKEEKKEKREYSYM